MKHNYEACGHKITNLEGKISEFKLSYFNIGYLMSSGNQGIHVCVCVYIYIYYIIYIY